MFSELIRGILPASPMLLVSVGFPPEEHESVRELAAASSQIVDLDAVDPGEPLGAPESNVVMVVARTVTDLRRAVSLGGLLPKAAVVAVAVAMSATHRSLAVPAPLPEWPPIRGLRAHQGPAGDWAFEVTFAQAMAVGEVLAAVVRGVYGCRLQAMPGPRVALAGVGAERWRPADPGVSLTTMSGPLGNPGGPAPADLVLRVTGPRTVAWSDARVREVIDRPPADWAAGIGVGAGVPPPGPSWADAGVDMVPPIDERSVNPAGFVATPELGAGMLAQTGDRWSIQLGDQVVVRFHPSGTVTDADVAKLRRLRAVRIEWGLPGAPIAAVRLVAGLAAAGVPLQASYVPPWAAPLGAELAGLIVGADAADLADDLRREEHSVRLRRASLRTHSTQARWRRLARTTTVPMPPDPPISVLLCTRRPEFLDFALRQIARQRYVDLEVILTLHGFTADAPAVAAAVAGFDRPITIVEVPAEVPFGAALSQGARRASGRYVAKWDDDDWYGPEFLADMLLASSYSGAELVGCHAQFVYLRQIDLTIYRPACSERMIRAVSGGTFFLAGSALDAVGGFPPVPRHVDGALLDVLGAAGARVYRTHSLDYVLHRRAAGHTWNEPIGYFLRTAAAQWRGLRFSAFVEPIDHCAAVT